MNLFFVPRVKQGKESVAYIVYLIIILTIFFVFQYPLFNLLSNWLGLLVLTLLYEGNRKKKFMIGTLIYVVNMMCDCVAAFMFSDYMVGDSISQIFSIFTTLFVFVCEIIVEK